MSTSSSTQQPNTARKEGSARPRVIDFSGAERSIRLRDKHLCDKWNADTGEVCSLDRPCSSLRRLLRGNASELAAMERVGITVNQGGSTPKTDPEYWAEKGKQFQARVKKWDREQAKKTTPSLERVVKGLRDLGLSVALGPNGTALTRCPNHDEPQPFLDIWTDGDKVGLFCRFCECPGPSCRKECGCTIEEIKEAIVKARSRIFDFSEKKAAPHLKAVRDDEPLEAPLILPEEFYESRAVLRRIRRYAHSRGASADAVLYATLARLSAALPPECRLDTGIGSELGASLNLFVAAVGESGGGKSTGMAVSKHTVAVPLGLIDDLPIGTGEGLVEAYMGKVTREDDEGKLSNVRGQVRSNAFFFLDEGQALMKMMMERGGTTIGPMIRSAWYGTTIGNQNADVEKRRIVSEGSYCMGMVIGFQPDTIQPLLADEAPGTPQRFVYCWTTDSTKPHRGWKEEFEPKITVPTTDTKITLVESVAEEMWNHHHAQDTGKIKVHRLDAHAYLTRAKLATLLTLLGRRTRVSEGDWHLAGVMWNTSCRVRDELLLRSREHVQRQREDRKKQRVESDLASARALRADQEAEELAKLEQHARRLALTVHTADRDSWSPSDLRRTLKADFRPRYQEAIDLAVDKGWLALDDSDKVLPGASKPAK